MVGFLLSALTTVVQTKYSVFSTVYCTRHFREKRPGFSLQYSWFPLDKQGQTSVSLKRSASSLNMRSRVCSRNRASSMSYLRDASLLEDWIIKHGHPDFNSAVTREGCGSGRHFVFLRRFQVVLSGSKWFQVVPSGSKWFQVVPSGSKWFQVVPSGSKWFFGGKVLEFGNKRPC
jgi:hypothetical protein